MSTSKLHIQLLLLLLVLLPAMMQAQETTVDRNVTVERDFQPVVQDAGKISSLPEILNINISKERVAYSDFLQTLPIGKNFFNLPAVEVIHRRRPISREAIVRLGMGNYWNTFGEIALPLINSEKARLDLRLDHLGTFGTRKHSLTGAGLDFNRYFPRYDLYAGVKLSHEYFNYYGKNFSKDNSEIDLNDLITENPNIDPLYTEQSLELITRPVQSVRLSNLAAYSDDDILWRFNAHAGIRSLPNPVGLTYSGELNFDLFNSQNGLQENLIRTLFGYQTTQGSNRLGMDFELTNLFYSKNNLPVLNFWEYYAVFSMNPYYLIDNTDLYLKAGVKASFSFIHGRPFNPMPDIIAEWKVLPHILSVYGGITGDFSISTLSSIAEENPYVFTDLRVKDAYTPINLFVGFKVKTQHNLLIDAFMDYRFIDDQYFFVNKGYKTTQISGAGEYLYTNRFNAVYSDASLFRVGLRGNYNIRNMVNVQLKGVYNGWSVEEESYAWMKPAFEADLSADWRITRGLSASANFFLEGARYAKIGTDAIRMRPRVDLNLGASYAFNRTFSTFARVNNLVNSKYEYFYGYSVQGINFLLGGAISF